MNMGAMLCVPVQYRSFAIAINIVCLHAFGDVPAPVIIGLLKDTLAPRCVAAADADDDNVAATDACRSQSDRLRLTMFIAQLWLIWVVIFFIIAAFITRYNMRIGATNDTSDVTQSELGGGGASGSGDKNTNNRLSMKPSTDLETNSHHNLMHMQQLNGNDNNNSRDSGYKPPSNHRNTLDYGHNHSYNNNNHNNSGFHEMIVGVDGPDNSNSSSNHAHLQSHSSSVSVSSLSLSLSPIVALSTSHVATADSPSATHSKSSVSNSNNNNNNNLPWSRTLNATDIYHNLEHKEEEHKLNVDRFKRLSRELPTAAAAAAATTTATSRQNSHDTNASGIGLLMREAHISDENNNRNVVDDAIHADYNNNNNNNNNNSNNNNNNKSNKSNKQDDKPSKNLKKRFQAFFSKNQSNINKDNNSRSNSNSNNNNDNPNNSHLQSKDNVTVYENDRLLHSSIEIDDTVHI
jgi:hypothetical protein